MASGLLFDYREGFVRVTFGPSHDDWIPMLLTLHGDTVITTPCDDHFEKGEPNIAVKDDVLMPMHIASIWCAFDDLIHWLEAVVVGVQECAMAWDAEGPDGQLRWCRGYPGKDGFLTAKWYGKKTMEHRVRLGTAQMVGAFYRSFRTFVTSENYDPLRYEELTMAGVAGQVLEPDAMDALAGTLAHCDAIGASRLLGAVLDVAYFHHVGADRMGEPKHPRPASLEYCLALATSTKGEVSTESDLLKGSWFLPEWDAWSFEQRKSDVLDAVYPHACGFTYGGGVNLRQLRSDIIENWLAKHDAITGKAEGRNRA